MKGNHVDDKVEDTSPTADVNVTSRYRRFIISGMARSLITRLVSIIFIGIIYTTVAKNILDKSVILSVIELVIVKVSLLGLPFALTRQSIVRKFTGDEIYSNASIAILAGVPVSVGLAVISSLLVPMSATELLLYILVVGLNLIVEVIYVVNNCFLDSDISLISQAVYSILTSFTVPLFYIIYPSLSSVITSWLFSMMVSLLVMKKHFFKLNLRALSLSTYFSIIKFGLPVYFSQTFDTLIQRVDLFLIYVLFPVGDTSLYYYVMKIAVIVQQLFVNMFSGMFPLLAKIYSRNDHKGFYKLVNSVLRLSLLASVIFYSPFIFQAQIVLLVVLREVSQEGVLILKLIVLGYMLRSAAFLIDPVLKTEGRRNLVALAILFGNITRLSSIALLIRYGSSGLAGALIVESVMIMLFYLGTMLRILDGAGRYLRILVFMIVLTSVSFFLPPGSLILSAVMASVMFAGIILGLSFVLKPLFEEDWAVIERIIGKRFSKKFSWLKIILVNGK